MMQPSAAADGLAQGAGAAIASRVRPEGPTSWLAPAWSVLCGVIASGAFGWQGRAEWLRLALLMLLVEAGWTALWSALGKSDWAAPVAAWRDWPRQGRAARLPYTLPGTPGDRSAHWLGQLRAWWSRCLWPTYGPVITTAVAAFLSTVVLALLLGPEIALLSVAAIAAMQIGLASERGRGRVTPGWNAVVTVLLPWLAGHVAFAPLTIASAWSAANVALAFAALSGLAQSGGRAALIVAHLSLAGLLIATHHPLTAACVLVLLAPQLMLVPWLQRHQPAAHYLRYSRVWLLAVALITAWVL